MPRVIGVRFKEASKIYYFDPAGHEDLDVGMWVIVDTARGQEAGQVVIAPMDVEDDQVVGHLKPIIRRASAWDMVQMARSREREEQALARCREKVAEYGLPMKLVRAEYNFDGSRLTIFFTAEKRVDFRQLVRDLARSFRTRIELRQIGVRDEAKLMGGLGCCGRSLCCATWLSEFHPVSIKMAKQQNLPLSPMEISGVCGRLLCCLAYENDYYCQVKKGLPKVGAMVNTPQGTGRLRSVNVLTETASVELENELTVEVPLNVLQSVRKDEQKREKKRKGQRTRRRRR